MPTLKKSSLYLNDTLHRELKIMAARLGTTMNQCLEEAVGRWLEEQENKLNQEKGYNKE